LLLAIAGPEKPRRINGLRFSRKRRDKSGGLRCFTSNLMIVPDVRLADTAPVARPGKLWSVLQFPMTRLLVAALPIFVVMGATDQVIVTLGLAAGGMASSLIALAGTLLGVAIYAGYVRWIERRRLIELGRVGAAGELGGGFAVGVGLFVVTVGLLVLIGAGRVDGGDGLVAIVPWLLWVAATATLEEILFRGVVFRVLEERLGTWISLAVSAALFGGLHAANANASIASSLAIAIEAGVLLAAAYTASRRLWLPIGLHAGWNLAQLGLLGVQRPGHVTHGVWSSRFTGPALLTGGDWGPEISIFAVAACVAAALAFLVLAKRRGRIVSPFWARRAKARVAP
jgi:membrane protease YdiL (CAAX protease family)